MRVSRLVSDRTTWPVTSSAPNAVFVLWGKPTMLDLDRVVQRVELTAATRASPSVFIARMTAPPPPEDQSRV